MHRYTNDVIKGRMQMMVELCMRQLSAHNPLSTVPTRPCVPPAPTRLARATAIMEAALDAIHSLGVDVYSDGDRLVAGDLQFKESGRACDLISIVDALCNLDFSTVGTASTCGVAHEPCARLVAANHLLKFSEGHSIREGKLVRPKDHPPIRPALRDMLIQQGAKPEDVNL